MQSIVRGHHKRVIYSNINHATRVERTNETDSLCCCDAGHVILLARPIAGHVIWLASGLVVHG